MHNQTYRKGRRAFTLVELLVVIAIILLLASLINPAVRRALLRAREISSISNLRTIGTSTILYSSDHNGALFPASQGEWAAPYWPDYLEGYLPPKTWSSRINIQGNRYMISSVLIDPTQKNGLHHSISDYGVNTLVFRVGQPPLFYSHIAGPGRLVMVVPAEVRRHGDVRSSWFIATQQYINDVSTLLSRPSDRGTGNLPCLFFDGHVELRALEEVDEYRRDLFVDNF